MGLQKVERARKFLVYEYDAVEDGGTAATYTMRNLDALNTLAADVVLLDSFIHVITAKTDADGGSAGTCLVGYAGTTNAYSASAAMVAAASGAIVAPQTTVKLTKLTSNQITPIVTVGAGGFTALKIRLYVEYVLPL